MSTTSHAHTRSRAAIVRVVVAGVAAGLVLGLLTGLAFGRTDGWSSDDRPFGSTER